MIRFLTLIILGVTPLYVHADTELIFPWVTNNSQFRGVIIVNNPSVDSVTVMLVARRNNGDTASATRTIAPFEQLVEGTDTLFSEIGEGPGFSVQLTSDANDIVGAFVIRGTASASGSSPAQANVSTPDDASQILMFSYLPVPAEGGDSAPVVVNMGSDVADVRFHGYQDGQKVGTFAVMVDPLRPYANVTSAMFAGVVGDLYVVAESDQPILGMAFIFNSETEPSMANAVPFSNVPEPLIVNDLVSFAVDIQPIFDLNCALSGCHSGGSPDAGLDLTATVAYGQTVNVKSVQSALDRVEPFEPQNSYLLHKLDADPSNNVQARMPNMRPPLSDSDIATIETWILEGAMNN